VVIFRKGMHERQKPKGFRVHVVATLAQGEAGTPIRVVSILAAGQRVVLSTPQRADAIEISRKGDSVFVRNANTASN